MRGDVALKVRVLPRIQVELQHALGLTAQQREDAVGRKRRKRLGEVKVVAVFASLGFLAFGHAGDHVALAVELLAQVFDQIRVHRQVVDEDRAGPLQGRLGVGVALRKVADRELFWGGRWVVH